MLAWSSQSLRCMVRGGIRSLLLEVLRTCLVLVFILQQGNEVVLRDEVACVNGKLKSMRSQLEFLKGELDRALVLVDEGLGSIGLKVAK